MTISSSSLQPLDQNYIMLWGNKGVITDLYGTTLGKASVVWAAQQVVWGSRNLYVLQAASISFCGDLRPGGQERE